MTYTKLFDPTLAVHPLVPVPARRARGNSAPPYDWPEEAVMAVNIALATGQPLLVRGEPGCGKSTLSRAVARKLGWRYYEEVVTSRTEARDLLWRFDAVRRLADAQASSNMVPGAETRLKADGHYIEPRGLWWALEPELARTTTGRTAPAPPEGAQAASERAVVLIDEIDKADPDLPNDLLDLLDAGRFTVAELGLEVEAKPDRLPMIVIATNEDRDLPPAFLRRCIALSLPPPRKEDRLIKIGNLHFPGRDANVRWAAATTMRHRKDAGDGKRKPSIAEFLDLVAALESLGPDMADQVREQIARMTLLKDPPPTTEPTPA